MFPNVSEVPTLKELVKFQTKVKEIKHFKHKLNPTSLSGNLISKFKGQGLEFLQVRKYYPGDDIKNIDWKVTARVGHTQIKEFQIEKESEIAIISNIGAEMQFATFGKFKYLIACDIIALLCYAAEANKEKISAYFFGNNHNRLTVFRQKNQKTIALEIFAFLTKKQSLKTKNTENNLLNSLKELNLVNKAKGILFIICDFNQIDQMIMDEIEHLKQRKTVYLCHIYDNCEKELPDIGNLTFSDYDGKKFTINSNDKKALANYTKSFEKKQQLLKKLSQDPNIYLINLPTNSDPLEQLVNRL